MIAKSTKSLTDTILRNIKPSEKAQKLFDGNGLFLFVSPNGTKSWRVKYRFQGREKLLTPTPGQTHLILPFFVILCGCYAGLHILLDIVLFPTVSVRNIFAYTHDPKVALLV